MTASLAPNAAIPAGLRRKVALDSSALTAATGHAAGVLHIAPDGDILLLRRSPKEENFAGHWSLPGGGVDEGETPEDGAARENREEMAIDVDPGEFKVFDQTQTPTGKVFHTFAAPAKVKFWPKINDEHTGAGWFPLSELPRPIHPAVEASLKGRLGDDFTGAGEGLAAWARLADEEEPAPELEGASDSAFLIAMDRDSVREKTRDGRLIVKKTNISKANVCPYRGKEIPGFDALGLDPEKIYNLLRDPDELRKAAPTLNGVQLLIKHIPVNADDHRPNETVGSLGTDADFDGEYLTNSLFVNAKHAIDAIESHAQRELSAGYHYKPDMTPGNFRGSAYDGVMREIVFNHVALVEDGRAGPDVVVGDQALRENEMAKVTRFGAMSLSLTAAAVAPLLAMDQKVTLPGSLFAPLTSKNFKENREKLLSGVRLALDGKLRKGLALDATMKDLAKVVDAFPDDIEKGIDEAAPEDKQDLASVSVVEAPAKAIAEEGSTYDSGNVAEFLRGKGMGEDDIKAVCDMFPKPALDEEDDAAKKKREEEEAVAKTAKDAEMKDMVTKPAMDAALKAQGESFAKEIAKVRDNERGIRAAIAEVHPWTGDLAPTMAFDSAADVYRHALEMGGVDNAKKLHADALLPILKTLPKPGARAGGGQDGSEPVLAMDASAVSKAVKLAPGLEHISTI